MPDDDRVILVAIAVLDEKMDNVQTLLQDHITLYREAHKEHDARIRKTELKIVSLDQRMWQTTGILGALQAAVIAVTTWLGLRQ